MEYNSLNLLSIIMSKDTKINNLLCQRLMCQ